MAAPAWAAPSFPRGPGYYYNPYNLGALLVAYLLWVRLCRWADEDALTLNLSTSFWNTLLLGSGLAGLACIWLLPNFWLSFIIFTLVFGTALLCYVHARNQRADDDDRVLTEKHMRELLKRYLSLDFKGKKKKAKDEKAGVPVRFIGRSLGQKNDDPDRVSRAGESKGYKGALDMVYEAVQRRATDIHLEPTAEEMTLRLRIDGMLNNAAPFSRPMGDAVINIFKVLCNMDITEKRKPQDGSFSAQVEDRMIDFRVATAGSVGGEKMVMRILDKSQQIIDLTGLGMRDKMRDQVHSLVTQPHGLLLVCGPTGAGKSTTLYACLAELDRHQQNIITIENPVEYQLEGITQIEVNVKADKTFASELRSILRQDPDVIMIGEIRDRETAEIACQAAQTGHMVFSTLHANDTVTAIGRLLDLGVPPFNIASALSGVLSQRLVRLLCPKCKVRYKPNPELLRKANLPVEKINYFYRPPENQELVDADGETIVCETCAGSGYFRRSGIYELLIVNDKVRALVRDNPNLTAIKQEAVKGGLRFLYEDGLRLVVEGQTSIQELLRVSK